MSETEKDLAETVETNASAPPSHDSEAELLRPLSEAQQEQLRRYLALLLEANQAFNLTAIREPSEAWSRHILESLRLLPLFLPHIKNGSRVLDVGSGGGLPGMILAIGLRDAQVTLLEATEKKARFLEETATKLGLLNVTVVCARAEAAGATGSALRETFDVVTARAVAALPTLLELTVPFAKTEGHLIFVKGERAEDELASAKRALQILHTRAESSVRHPTASVLTFRKFGQTPAKYPRRVGEPKHKPL